MNKVKYTGIERLREHELIALEGLIKHYSPIFERKLPRFELVVSLKKSKLLGQVGRFDMGFTIISPKGRFLVEQSGWGLVKTTHRCGEHMKNLLDHRIRKEMLTHRPRKPKGKRR